MMASSSSEMEDWAIALMISGASTTDKNDSTRARDDTASPEEEKARVDALPENDKNGWLEKKGRKRWFILRHGRLAWYKQLEEDEAGLSNPAGSLEMKECAAYKLDKQLKGKFVLVLSAKNRETKKGDYFLLHSEEKEIDEWLQVLIEKGGVSKETGEKKKEEPAKGLIFGRSLEEVLAKEGNPHGIPEVVEKCVSYIRLNGMDVEGIFRVSGETSDVHSLKTLFEERASKGDKGPFLPKSDFAVDIHAITGVLKLFFRELTPPLMTFELYGDFMTAANSDISVVKTLVDRLPEANRRVLKYLLFFLNEVAQHADNNRMRPMNLAIVFSPNLFKSDRPAVEVLANSGNAATITQMLVINVSTFFPEGPDQDLTPPPSPSPNTGSAIGSVPPVSSPPLPLNTLPPPPPPSNPPPFRLPPPPPRVLSTSLPASSFLGNISTSLPPPLPPPPTPQPMPPTYNAPVPPRPLSMAPGTAPPVVLATSGGSGSLPPSSRPVPPPARVPAATSTSPRAQTFLAGPHSRSAVSNGASGQ